jgi:hypothetical protein
MAALSSKCNRVHMIGEHNAAGELIKKKCRSSSCQVSRSG